MAHIRLLLVDDEERFLETTKTLLEMLNSSEDEESLSPTEIYLQNYYNNAEEQSILDLLG